MIYLLAAARMLAAAGSLDVGDDRTLQIRAQHSQLSHEIILRSHHPEIYDASLDELRELRQRLREMRDKARTLARENRRAVRGKGTQRGASFPGTAEHPLRRKQVFAAALKRVNRELDRMHELEART